MNENNQGALRRKVFWGVVYGLSCLFLSGCISENKSQGVGKQPSGNKSQSIGKQQNDGIDAFVRIEKVTEKEKKFVATRHRLVFLKNVPLNQFLASDIIPEILGIGATVKLEIVTAEIAAKLDPSRTTVVVGASKGEFTFEDEIVFFVYFPSAAN